MLVGVFHFPTDYGIDVGELARELEAREFESLFVCEHTHIPVSRRTPFPGGEPLPKEYSHTFDPFVSLMAAAAVTTRLKIGTGICLIIERDTITTAKEVASLDLLSGGRFLFGIGAGWNQDEMENHGTEYKSRFKRMREQVLAMKEIWTKDEAQFHGQHVNFDPIWSWPKPVQVPHPPVLVGGDGPRSLRVAGECGDGWMPVVVEAAGFEAKLTQLHRLCEEAGLSSERRGGDPELRQGVLGRRRVGRETER